MDDDVVGRIEPLTLPLFGDHGLRAIGLIAHHAAAAMFAGKLPALVVKGIAVGIAGGVAVDAHVAVFFQPAELPGIRNVAPNQTARVAVPGRAFHPQTTGVEPLDWGVTDHVAAETVIERDDVGVGVANGLRKVSLSQEASIASGGSRGGASEEESPGNHGGI